MHYGWMTKRTELWLLCVRVKVIWSLGEINFPNLNIISPIIKVFLNLNTETFHLLHAFCDNHYTNSKFPFSFPSLKGASFVCKTAQVFFFLSLCVCFLYLHSVSWSSLIFCAVKPVFAYCHNLLPVCSKGMLGFGQKQIFAFSWSLRGARSSWSDGLSKHIVIYP